MTYVAPTTRGEGFTVPASVWNQDVVANMEAIYALTQVTPSVVIERQSTSYNLVNTTWTTRRLSKTVRDPQGIIKNADYPNYQFDLSDGDYLVEFLSFLKMASNNSQDMNHRLRDIDNNTTICGAMSTYHPNHSGGIPYHSEFSWTSYAFTLANISDTTIELQSRADGGTPQSRMGNNLDTDNVGENGVYDSMIKLWKIG
jgi:hypothetical protein